MRLLPEQGTQEQERETDTEATVCYNLISKVSRHYFCLFLLFGIKLLNPTYTQPKRPHENEVMGDRLRAWLRHHARPQLIFTNNSANTVSTCNHRQPETQRQNTKKKKKAMNNGQQQVHKIRDLGVEPSNNGCESCIFILSVEKEKKR